MKPILLRVLIAFFLLTRMASGEAMLQYFNTSWAEITRKMPELAEAGYQSLWVPPPTKGSGGLSVGYDLWDPFDLGGKDQRGGVRTRYGTEAELLQLVATAHRFGIRVYFDNIMNHRAFDVPGYNESTPIDIYPGMAPEDFHLRVTEDGFYRKWDNTRDWSSASPQCGSSSTRSITPARAWGWSIPTATTKQKRSANPAALSPAMRTPRSSDSSAIRKSQTF